jgi:hypothetical protein
MKATALGSQTSFHRDARTILRRFLQMRAHSNRETTRAIMAEWRELCEGAPDVAPSGDSS